MDANNIDRLINGVIAAENALNIDMGDGEPTYQCCNAVCGHFRCPVGDALQVLIENGLVVFCNLRGKWIRMPATQEPSIPTEEK